MFEILSHKEDRSVETYRELFSLNAKRCAQSRIHKLIWPNRLRGSLPVRVVGRACPAYAAAEEGPRLKPGIGPEEFNSPRNLVLLCPRHHGAAAGGHELHPAGDLALWKRSLVQREAAARGAGFPESSGVSGDRFMEALVAREIEDGAAALGKFRFFEEFEAAARALRFAERLGRGDLRGGPAPARRAALALCSRILSLGGNPGEAEKCLDAAKSLGDCEENRGCRRSFGARRGRRGKRRGDPVRHCFARGTLGGSRGDSPRPRTVPCGRMDEDCRDGRDGP